MNKETNSILIDVADGHMRNGNVCSGKGELSVMYGTSSQHKELHDVFGDVYEGIPVTYANW